MSSLTVRTGYGLAASPGNSRGHCGSTHPYDMIAPCVRTLRSSSRRTPSPILQADSKLLPLVLWPYIIAGGLESAVYERHELLSGDVDSQMCGTTVCYLLVRNIRFGVYDRRKVLRSTGMDVICERFTRGAFLQRQASGTTSTGSTRSITGGTSRTALAVFVI